MLGHNLKNLDENSIIVSELGKLGAERICAERALLGAEVYNNS